MSYYTIKKFKNNIKLLQHLKQELEYMADENLHEEIRSSGSITCKM